jgi:hypothetical protein
MKNQNARGEISPRAFFGSMGIEMGRYPRQSRITATGYIEPWYEEAFNAAIEMSSPLAPLRGEGLGVRGL